MGKAALAALGVGVAASGAVMLGGKAGDGIPSYHFLSEDEGYWKDESRNSIKDEYNDKYGSSYGHYLVGITTSKERGKNNDAWWEWAFKNRYLPKKDEAKGKFKELAQANKTFINLREICTSAYKEKLNEKILSTWTADDNNKFLEKDILYFCSPLGKKPTTLSSREDEKNKYTGKIGAASDKITKLVSTEDPDNALFWERRNHNFFDVVGTFSGKTSSDNTFFKNPWDKGISSKITIKDKCKEAYGKETTTSTSTESAPKPDEVLKYCSWEGK